MRVPKAGNGEMMGEEVTMLEMERTDYVQREREGMEETGLRDEEDKQVDEDEEEGRRVDKVVGQSGHLYLLIALLLSVALLAIGFLVRQVSLTSFHLDNPLFKATEVDPLLKDYEEFSCAPNNSTCLKLLCPEGAKWFFLAFLTNFKL